jgi:hypothetical protein
MSEPEHHVVEVHERYARLAPGPAPVRDKWPTWEWDDTTTASVVKQKAIEKLHRTPYFPPESSVQDGLLYDQMEYVALGYDFKYSTSRWPGNTPLPRFRQLAIYAVEGSNEGHYVHVDLIIPRDRAGDDHWESVTLIFFKTFGGLRCALDVVCTLTEYFNFNQ